MNRFSLLCVTLGLALSPAAAVTLSPTVGTDAPSTKLSKPKCGILKTSKKCGNVAGCSWMKTGTQKFKKCQNVGEAEVTVVATAPSVETNCAAFDGQSVKCRKQDGCDWYKTAGQMHKTCQAVVTATAPPTPAPSEAPSEAPRDLEALSLEFLSMVGCCRVDYKDEKSSLIAEFMFDVLSGADEQAEYDAKFALCEENCLANSECEAFEFMQKSKPRRYRCELHRGGVNTASRGNPSCKKATCEVLEYTGEISSEAPSETPSEVPSEVVLDVPSAAPRGDVTMKGCCRVDYADKRSFSGTRIEIPEKTTKADAFDLCMAACGSEDECYAFELRHTTDKKKITKCEFFLASDSKVGELINSARPNSKTCRETECTVDLDFALQ